MSNSEYQVEYCGLGGGFGGGSGSHGGQGGGMIPCSKSLEEQPVGGKSQARARAAVMASATSKTGRGLPAHDADFVAQVYSGTDRGTHRVQPEWKDPRWSDEMRASSSTLYNPAARDPPNRNSTYVYRTTLVDSLQTPCYPLPVPDVHKLRYMQNNYMTQDDWY